MSSLHHEKTSKSIEHSNSARTTGQVRNIYQDPSPACGFLK